MKKIICIVENKYRGIWTKKKAFSLIEVLVVMAIIGIIAVIIFVSLGSATGKARDAKRKTELAQIGRFISLGCYMPNAGANEYDILVLVDELKAKYPQYAQYVSLTPKDPKSGSETESKYYYIITVDNKCVLYANLENKDEAVTLPSINTPTPGGGTGVFQAGTGGWNGSDKYFQISN